MRLRALTVGAVAGLLLAGCGGSDDEAPDPQPSASEPTAAVNPKEPACSFLSPGERKKLVGSRIDEIVATGGSGDSSQCRWQADAAVLQVTTLPAREWAKTLPDVVAQLEKSEQATPDDTKDLARARKLLAGADSFTDEQACAAFSTLAEIGGADKGATTTITPVPITETEVGLSAQICSAGELTSLIFSTPGLKQTKKVDAAVTTALKQAQKRAVAIR